MGNKIAAITVCAVLSAGCFLLGGFSSVSAASAAPKTLSVLSQHKSIAVKKIKLSKTSLTLVQGKSYTLKASISPSNATSNVVKWKSSNNKVAAVSGKGKITAKRAGSCTITASSTNGKKATCRVTVKSSIVSVTSVKINQSTAMLIIGNTVILKANVSPSNATNKAILWSSSNNSIATVSSTGTVTGVASGTCTIIATSNNGKQASCSVTVQAVATAITLSQTTLSIASGNTANLTATITPSDAVDKTVTWSSSNTAIATVTADGSVTAYGLGKCTITASTANGIKASCAVTVGVTDAYRLMVQHDITTWESTVASDEQAVTDAQTSLTNVENQKDTQVWNGTAWEYVANPTRVANAEQALTDAQSTLTGDQSELAYWKQIADTYGISYQ